MGLTAGWFFIILRHEYITNPPPPVGGLRITSPYPLLVKEGVERKYGDGIIR